MGPDGSTPATGSSGGVVFPVAVLSALLVYDRGLSHALRAPPPPDAPRIEVEGRQWWWEVHAPGAAGRDVVVAANEIHLPVGTAVDWSSPRRT